MKKILLILLIFFLGIIIVNAKTYPNLNIRAEHAILYNLNDDILLYEKNSKEKTEIASLTKMMTVLVALENITDVKETVTMDKKAFTNLVKEDASVAGFEINEKVTYEDLLYGAMLPSGADASNQLGISLFGSQEAFILEMNNTAKRLNMLDTVFKTTSGLDRDGQYSTVFDQAILLKYALNNDHFSKIFKAKKYTTSSGRVTFQSNLRRYMNSYDISASYILGGKTGSTDLADLCLASIASKDNVDYLLITTKSDYDQFFPYNITDAKTIYEYYIQNYSYQLIINKDKEVISLNTTSSSPKTVNLKAKEEVSFYLKNEEINLEENKITFKYQGKDTLSFFDKKGDIIGSYIIYYEEKEYRRIDLYLDEKISFSPINLILENLFITIVIILLLVLLIKITNKKRRKKKIILS